MNAAKEIAKRILKIALTRNVAVVKIKRNNNMPIPSPKGPEQKKDFVSKCMSDSVMSNEFPEEKQRAAVCFSKWKKSKSSEYLPEDEDSDVIIY